MTTDGGGAERWWSTVGRRAWTVVGVAAVVALAGLAVAHIRLIVIPLILGLFLAGALHPVTRWLCAHRAPRAVAALASLLLLMAVLGGIGVGLVPLVMADLPDLAQQLSEGVGRLDQLLRGDTLGTGVGSVSDLLQQGADQLSGQGGMADGALAVATAVVGSLVGLVLVVVTTFFYLKDGDRFAEALVRPVPARHRADARTIGQLTWATVGGYLRGQLVVAVFDAVLIGLGLVLLGVPLALPLAVLVLVGGLFPIVGAVVSGTLAVLVALADGGFGLALAVLALVVAVQQVESNVLQPVVLGRVVALHPFVVLLSITLGAVLLGVFGAFIAVPVAASVARAVEHLTATRPAGPAPEEAEPPMPVGSGTS
jgi:predicted PurR-regulated permease PerM